MFKCIIFLLFSSLFIATKAQNTPNDYIFLALRVSEAAYTKIIGSSGVVYHQIIKDSQGSRLCPIGGWTVKYTGGNSDTEVLLFIDTTKKLAVFGFRGTETSSGRDILTDLKINMRCYRAYCLHSGFDDYFSNIRNWFLNEYGILKRNRYRIILTGHSLGGALATIAAVHASFVLNYPPVAVITFGSPKVGNGAFQRYYNNYVGCSRTLRFVVQGDPVADIPGFDVLLRRYYHVCRGYYLQFPTNSRKRGNINVSAHSIKESYGVAINKRYGRSNCYGCCF